MRDLLVVMNPRAIAECLSSYHDLAIDRLMVRYMTEAQIAARWPEILEVASAYDNLIVVSDDVVVRQPALDAVRRLLDTHPVVTGYCNLALDDMRVNLTGSPLGPEPAESAYHFLHLGAVMTAQQEAVPTFFTGMALTAMSVEMWRRFPFDCYGPRDGGNASDFHLSKRLERAGVPIVAARDGFVWHVKDRWNRGDSDPRKRLLIGLRPASIDLITRR